MYNASILKTGTVFWHRFQMINQIGTKDRPMLERRDGSMIEDKCLVGWRPYVVVSSQWYNENHATRLVVACRSNNPSSQMSVVNITDSDKVEKVDCSNIFTVTTDEILETSIEGELSEVSMKKIQAVLQIELFGDTLGLHEVFTNTSLTMLRDNMGMLKSQPNETDNRIRALEAEVAQLKRKMVTEKTIPYTSAHNNIDLHTTTQCTVDQEEIYKLWKAGKLSTAKAILQLGGLTKAEFMRFVKHMETNSKKKPVEQTESKLGITLTKGGKIRWDENTFHIISKAVESNGMDKTAKMVGVSLSNISYGLKRCRKKYVK